MSPTWKRHITGLAAVAFALAACGSAPATDDTAEATTITTSAADVSTTRGAPATDPAPSTTEGEQTHFEVLWECRENEGPPPGGGLGYTCRSNEAVRTAMFGQVDWLMQITYQLDDDGEEVIALSGSASARGGTVCDWFGQIGEEFQAPVSDGKASFEYVMAGGARCEDKALALTATWDLNALTLDMTGDVVPADY